MSEKKTTISRYLKDFVFITLGVFSAAFGFKGFLLTNHFIDGETILNDIVYTVITRLELNRLNEEIEKIDSNAFIVISSIKDTKRGMIKKRPLQH